MGFFFLYGYGALLGGPLGLRSSAIKTCSNLISTLQDEEKWKNDTLLNFYLLISIQSLIFEPQFTIQTFLLYSWHFSHYSMPIYWLAHGQMTSNNETVSRQMPWVGNIAKTMTSNGKQFTVTREMLTAVARDQRWPDVVAGISARFSKFAFVLFCYITNHLMTGPLGKSEFCFPQISTLRFLGNKIHCSPWDQSLSVKYYTWLTFDKT